MSKAVEFGAQGVQSVVRLFNMGTARPAPGVTVANTPGLKGAYRRDFENTVIFNLKDASQDAPYEMGNWIELGEGYYAIDPPYFAWEGGSRGVLVYADDPDVVNYFCNSSGGESIYLGHRRRRNDPHRANTRFRAVGGNGQGRAGRPAPASFDERVPSL